MALYRSAFRLVEGCTKTCQACPPNFQFFRTSFASSKLLSVVVRVLLFAEVCHNTSQIVMCLLACSAPKSNLAKPAVDVLNKAVALFETGIESGSVHLSENMVGPHSAVACRLALTLASLRRRLCVTYTSKRVKQWRKPEAPASSPPRHCERTNSIGSLA